MVTYTLKPFQKDGVDYALKHHYSIIGDAMGLGKTLQAIEVIKRSKLKAVVVCPAFLRGTWVREIRKFSNLSSVIFTSTSKKQDFDIAIISYSYLDKAEYLFRQAGIVIADEVHYLKNIEAKRTGLFHEYIRKYKPERFLGLSGTAIKNRVPEFYSLFLLCAYNPRKTSGMDVRIKFRSFWDFACHFCNVKKFRISGRNVTKFLGHKNLEEFKELKKGKYIRRKASDVLDLPPITRKDIVLSEDSVDSELLAAWNEQSPTSSFMTRKVNNAKIKVKHTVMYCKSLLAAGEGPLLIYTDHVLPAKSIANCLPNSRVITGEVSMDRRDQYVVEFQEGKIDNLVATIGSLSMGVTLTAARNVVFNDLSWVPGNIAQCEKRIHRIGQSHHCVVHRVFWGQVDVLIGKELDNKIKTLVEVL